MPRPIRPYTWGVPVLALAAALPPAALHGAFAAAAAGLFEAAPFVLASALLPRSRLSRLGPVLGCGCGGLLPAALSLPSVALCWFAFGPVPAALRVVAAALLAIRAGRRGAHAGPVPTADPLADLSALGIAAFAAALAGEGLRAIALPAASPPAALLARAVAPRRRARAVRNDRNRRRDGVAQRVAVRRRRVARHVGDVRVASLAERV